jgi:hypothetical protein
MQCREQSDDNHSGREKPKDAVEEVAKWIGISFERSSQDEPTDDEESNDCTGPV